MPRSLTLGLPLNQKSPNRSVGLLPISHQRCCLSTTIYEPRKRHGFTLDWYLLGVLIYELIEGMPPYYCLNKERLF